MTDHYEDDSEDDGFLEWWIRNTYEEAARLNGDFCIVLEDEVIYGLSYTEALDRAKQLIAEAGYTVWERLEANDWNVEFFVEESEDEDLVLFAVIESENAE